MPEVHEVPIEAESSEKTGDLKPLVTEQPKQDIKNPENQTKTAQEVEDASRAEEIKSNLKDLAFQEARFKALQEDLKKPRTIQQLASKEIKQEFNESVDLANKIVEGRVKNLMNRFSIVGMFRKIFGKIKKFLLKLR